MTWSPGEESALAARMASRKLSAAPPTMSAVFSTLNLVGTQRCSSASREGRKQRNQDEKVMTRFLGIPPSGGSGPAPPEGGTTSQTSPLRLPLFLAGGSPFIAATAR